MNEKTENQAPEAPVQASQAAGEAQVVESAEAAPVEEGGAAAEVQDAAKEGKKGTEK